MPPTPAPPDHEAATPPVRVGIVLFESVDLLDVGGPYEVFLTANRLVAREDAPAPFAVETVTADDQPVVAYGGLGLVASTAAAELDGLDVVVVPGTIDVGPVVRNDRVMDAIGRLVATSPLVATVCTGALILAGTGQLDDVALATTHHEDVGDLGATIGDRAVTARWVDAGSVVTSGGLSNGIAMALHLVDRLVGRDLARATAAQIEYAWEPDGGIAVT